MFKAFAQTITTPETLISLLVGAGAFATIMTLSGFVSGGNQLEKRMKNVAERREELRRKSRAAIADKDSKSSSLRQTDSSPYRAIVDKLNLKTLLEDPKVSETLAEAGFRGPKPISTYYFFRLVTPFVLAILTAFYMFVVMKYDGSGTNKLAILVGAFVAGYYAPTMYIKNIASKRRASIMQAFPDALDLLLICVEAGMSIEAALQRVSQEIGSRSIELAEELSLLVAELSYLPDRRLAYEGFAKRNTHPGVKSVATAMVQAEKYGTPLGSALRVMAKENRDLRLSAAEKKAAALPAQLTVPMILFFLPVLFLVIMGPVVIRISDQKLLG